MLASQATQRQDIQTAYTINREQAHNPRHDWPAEKNPVTKMTGRNLSLASYRQIKKPPGWTDGKDVHYEATMCNSKGNGRLFRLQPSVTGGLSHASSFYCASARDRHIAQRHPVVIISQNIKK